MLNRRMKKDLTVKSEPLLRPEPKSWPVYEDTITLTLTANAGILLDYAGTRILIDGLHSGTEGFSAVPPAMQDTIIAGEPPFENIGWLAYTHLHTDHFSASAMERFLQQHPEAGLLIPSIDDGVTGELSALRSCISVRQIRYWETRTMKEGFFTLPLSENLYLRAFSCQHAGEAYQDVVQSCYLLTCKTRNILFLGDADYQADFFSHKLAGIPIDAAVVNPLFISTPKGRQTLLEGIAPARVVVNHIPFHGEDPMRFRGMVARCLERYKEKLPPTVILWNAQDTVTL